MINEDELIENWLNGNRKDVVVALIDNGKLSDAITFALQLSESDRRSLVKMLQNRDS